MELFKMAKYAAEKIKRANEILVVSHIDADGICAAAIACIALEECCIEHKVIFFKSLDDKAIDEIKNADEDLIWLTDLGSGALSQLNKKNVVISDHHIPSGTPDENITFVNPHLYGINGEDEISGAGTTYLVAKNLTDKNWCLIPPAVIGAVGDLQDSKYRKLVGINKKIVDEGIKSEIIEKRIDIRFFGRETKPLYKMLQYSSDPIVPGLTGNEENCMMFLNEIGVPIKCGDMWRRWIDLKFEEKRKIVSAIVNRMLCMGISYKYAERITGEVYSLCLEDEGTEVHDVKEFATLLNACGRHDNAEIGLKVVMGDRDKNYEKATHLLQAHRKSLVDGLECAQYEGIERRENLQFFHGRDRIEETIVGIVAGMLLNSGHVDRDVPMIAFANCTDGLSVKVSARATKDLVDAGLNLSEVMRISAERVDGIGGGHSIAAGAQIPRGKENEFLHIVNEVIGRQLRSSH